MIAMFPGQGSQYVGMGKELVDTFGIARETFEEASETVKVDLKKLCFDGPESDLTLTENTQPCLLVTSVTAFRVAKQETGFTPKAVIGHSLGEYSALVAAGSLPLAAAAYWVKERGKAMQIAVPPGEGSMAAIMGLEEAVIRDLCKKATEKTVAERSTHGNSARGNATVEPANFNAPGQVVIAGSADAVAMAVQMAKTDPKTYKGAKAIPLRVSAPFHSSLMKPARDRMAELFSQATKDQKPKPLSVPYVPNCRAVLTREAGVIFELLVEQVDHPVLWQQSVEALMAAGFEKGVEFGPGKVLQGLGKRIARKVKKPLAISTVGKPDDLKAIG